MSDLTNDNEINRMMPPLKALDGALKNPHKSTAQAFTNAATTVQLVICTNTQRPPKLDAITAVIEALIRSVHWYSTRRAHWADASTEWDGAPQDDFSNSRHDDTWIDAANWTYTDLKTECEGVHVFLRWAAMQTSESGEPEWYPDEDVIRALGSELIAHGL